MASPLHGGRSVKTLLHRSTIPHAAATGGNLEERAQATYRAAIVDEAKLGQLAGLVARLTPAQQRLVIALADGFRGGWLEPFQWERAWRGSDLSKEVVLGDARTWLARRPRPARHELDHAG